MLLSLLLRHGVIVLHRALSLCDVEKLFALLVDNFDQVLDVLKKLWNLVERVKSLHRFESTDESVNSRF